MFPPSGKRGVDGLRKGKRGEGEGFYTYLRKKPLTSSSHHGERFGI